MMQILIELLLQIRPWKCRGKHLPASEGEARGAELRAFSRAEHNKLVCRPGREVTGAVKSLCGDGVQGAASCKVSVVRTETRFAILVFLKLIDLKC